MQSAFRSLTAMAVCTLVILICLASLATTSSAAAQPPPPPLTPQLLGRLYALAAGELARDPAGSARRLRAAAAAASASGQFRGIFGGQPSNFNDEEILSPECIVVFRSMLSTVLALVAGTDVPEYMEFIKWLDSIGKPEAGILLGNLQWIGSRQECEALKLPVYEDVSNASSVMFHTNGRYCTFQVNDTGTNSSGAFSGSDIGAQLQKNLGLAICMPNPCKGRDAEIATNFVIQFILGFLGPILQGIPGLGGILDSLKSFSLVVRGCSVTSQEFGGSLQPGAIIMITLTVILVAVILAATVLTGLLESRGRTMQGGVLHSILRAFCLRSNLTKLFAPSPPGSLACLNGVRVLSLFWVILGHSLLIIVGLLDNPLKLLDDYRTRWQSVLIINATTSVDSFFLLSGTLVAFVFFRRIATDPEQGMRALKTFKFWVLYYFHRYWRLTPPLMFFVFWQVSLLGYFGDGALMPKDRRMLDIDNCEKNWWTLPLYVQNFVRVHEGCIGHTWYLANDMQMYLISPLMLIPFLVGGIKTGAIVSVAVVAVSMICTGVINSYYGFRRGHLNLVPGEQDGYYPYTSYYEVVYIKPYCRIGAYAIGILLGYVFATRKSIKLPLPVVIVGWIVAAAGSLALLYLVQPQIAGTSGDLTVPQVTAYWAFLRPGFALCVGWVVFACVYGYGGPVNLILSWSWFAPLARLSYCAYVVHISVMYMFYVTYDAKFHLSDSMLIFMFLANLMATFLASLVLSMLLEAPLLGLEKALLGGPSSGDRTQPAKVQPEPEVPVEPLEEPEKGPGASDQMEMFAPPPAEPARGARQGDGGANDVSRSSTPGSDGVGRRERSAV